MKHLIGRLSVLRKLMVVVVAAIILAGGGSLSTTTSNALAADPSGYVYAEQDSFNYQACNFLGTGDFDRLLTVYGPWVNAYRQQYVAWWARVFDSSTGTVIPVAGGDANGWVYIGGQSVNPGWNRLIDSSTQFNFRSFRVSGGSPLRAQIAVGFYDGSTQNQLTYFIPEKYLMYSGFGLSSAYFGLKAACGG